MLDIKYVFQGVLDYIEEKFEVIDVTMNLYFKSLTPLVLSGQTAVLLCESDFKRTIICDRYREMLLEGLRKELGEENIDLTILTKKEYEEQQEEKKKQEERAEIEKQAKQVENDCSAVNPSYTFENFVVGSTNRVAYETSLLVCRSPAEYYNPLFIYGPSGLGKTHLLSAIINEVRKKRPEFHIVYITCEEFANMLIDSISKKIDPASFRSKFRSLDFLLVDDIQFLANKKAVQEEMFHTFETLYHSGKQIVFASDKHPSEMENIDKRLTTRFSMGGLIDIEPPDSELRQAIFKCKAGEYGVEIPNDVLFYLAENIRTNIRQIEGAIKTLKAHSLIGGEKISFEMAKRVLADYLKKAEEDSINSDKILGYVALRFGVRKEDITGPKRDASIKDARHLCAYLMRNMLNMTYKEIGLILKKHHTTIMDSCGKIENDIAESESFSREVREIKKALLL